jgi:hypothetical protein
MEDRHMRRNMEMETNENKSEKKHPPKSYLVDIVTSSILRQNKLGNVSRTLTFLAPSLFYVARF